MSLTAEQIKLVQDSLAIILDDIDVAGRMMYDRLFELDPNLQILFSETDIQLQGRQFIRMVMALVAALERPQELREQLLALAERHQGYGVQPEYYATMGKALVWMVNHRLGPAYTPEVQAAWEAAYRTILDVMGIQQQREN